MTELIANVRSIDRARSARLQLAWIIGDNHAFHHAMEELITDPDPSAVPGVLFANLSLATSLGLAGMSRDDLVGGLRASIIEYVKAQDAADE